jgi:hypothetical protein
MGRKPNKNAGELNTMFEVSLFLAGFSGNVPIHQFAGLLGAAAASACLKAHLATDC